MSMIPKNSTITINRTSLDSWGVRVENGITESLKCYISYKLEMRGNEVNTSRPSLEKVPTGTIFLDGLVEISNNDELSWTGYDGKLLRAKARAVDYIVDASGKVVFTKAVF